MLRRQLPVYSPILFRSLLAGFAGALGLGRPLERLRRRLSERYETPDLLLTDSGTTALRLAIEGALATRGTGSNVDVVALPAYCCFDVVTAAVGAGARVRLYDIDPATLGPDWASLKRALDAAAAAVAVHLYGIPVEMERFAALCFDRGVLAIEDAAQGFGGRIGERPLGAFGSLGILSFGRGKGITGGGGGALLANDEAGRAALAAARRVSSPVRERSGWGELARLAAQWLLGRPSLYGLPSSLPWLHLGETRYHEPWPPGGISRSAATAVLTNWEVSLEEARVRRRNATRVEAGAESIVPGAPVASFPRSPAPTALPGALRLPMLPGDGGVSRPGPADVRSSGAERGYPPLADLPVLRDRLAGEAACPSAARLAARLWTLPTHSLSDPSDTELVARRLPPE